jgi:hypothetical protein
MNKEISMKAIDEASHQKQGFAAVKMSSLGKPELLEHVSTCLHAVRRLFRSISNAEGKPRASDFYVRSVVSHEEFRHALVKMGAKVTQEDMEALCRAIDRNNNGIDYLEWIETLDPTSEDRCLSLFLQPVSSLIFDLLTRRVVAARRCSCSASCCPRTSNCPASASKSCNT